jgi:hypothetical protein
MRSLIIICLISMVIAGCDQKPQAVRSAGSDRYQVAEAALRSLMLPDPSSSFSAYAVDGGEFTSQLVASFVDYKPKVVGNIQIQLDPKNGVAIDKSTGKAVELWKVSDVEIRGDTASAKVYAHQSYQGAEWYTVHLRHTDGKWVVESNTLDMVS